MVRKKSAAKYEDVKAIIQNAPQTFPAYENEKTQGTICYIGNFYPSAFNVSVTYKQNSEEFTCSFNMPCRAEFWLEGYDWDCDYNIHIKTEFGQEFLLSSISRNYLVFHK